MSLVRFGVLDVGSDEEWEKEQASFLLPAEMTPSGETFTTIIYRTMPDLSTIIPHFLFTTEAQRTQRKKTGFFCSLLFSPCSLCLRGKIFSGTYFLCCTNGPNFVYLTIDCKRTSMDGSEWNR